MIAAAEVLILIGENGGDPIFALIAIIRAFRPSERRRHLHCAVARTLIVSRSYFPV